MDDVLLDASVLDELVCQWYRKEASLIEAGREAGTKAGERTTVRWKLSALVVAGIVGGVLGLVAVQHLGSTSEREYGRLAEGSPVQGEARMAVASFAEAAENPAPPGDNVSAEFGDEDPADSQWDVVAPAHRVERLREQFESALGSIEQGEDGARHVLIAEGALASLRAELYGSEQGRRVHRALEEQLEHAVDGPPVDAGQSRDVDVEEERTGEDR